MIKFLRIKWENIGAIFVLTYLTIKAIQYSIINGFDPSKIMFDILYITFSTLAVTYSLGYSRKMFLEEELETKRKRP